MPAWGKNGFMPGGSRLGEERCCWNCRCTFMALDMNGLAKLSAEEFGVREADDGELGTDIGDEDWSSLGLCADGESMFLDGDGVISCLLGDEPIASLRSGIGERAGGLERCFPGLLSPLSELAKPCSSFAKALSPVSGVRPTETKKFTPIFDFIEIGGEASSDGNGWASEAGGDAVERITLPWGIDVGKAVRGK